jgi:nucleotide-binding universal stress UspA family protein
MSTTDLSTATKVKNILYLTDFSEPSEAALPFAATLARGYGAKVHALRQVMNENQADSEMDALHVHLMSGPKELAHTHTDRFREF